MESLSKVVSEARPAEEAADILTEPPKLLSRGVLWLVLLLLASALIWAWLSSMDIIVTGHGTLRPTRLPVPITTSHGGRVVKVAVREGEEVRKGDVLITLDSRSAAEDVATLRHAREGVAMAKAQYYDDLPLEIGRLQEEARGERGKLESLEGLIAGVRVERATRVQETRLTQHKASLEVERKRGALQQARLNLQQAERGAALNKELYETHRRLAEKGLVARLQLLDVENRYYDALSLKANRKLEVQLAERGLEQERTALQQISASAATLEADYVRRERELEMQQRASRARLAQVEKDMELAERRARTRLATAEADYRRAASERAPAMAEKGARPDSYVRETESGWLIVTAPTDGTVSALQIKQPGVVTQPGEVMLKLLPAGSPLLVECTVANADIGTVKPGLACKVKFDAFPFAKYGSLAGQVVWVSPDSEPDKDGGRVYRVECSLESQWIKGEGRKADLKPGLTARVEIVTRRETILEILLKPFRELGGDLRG